MKNQKNNPLIDYTANPRLFTLKKWFKELLKERYQPHENVIERVSSSLITNKDVEDFGKLVGEIYEAAYRKAINDYKEQGEKMGFHVQVVASDEN